MTMDNLNERLAEANGTEPAPAPEEAKTKTKARTSRTKTKPAADAPAQDTPAQDQQAPAADAPQAGNVVAHRAPAGGSTLALQEGQTYWTQNQLAALQHLGAGRASEGDLYVFFHQATRTGLDPFAKQIYMIERQGKQTIQTGIDGFRLIGRRAVQKSGETLSIGDTEWCGPDGVWTDVWLQSTPPAAARVSIYRNGDRFPAIALFSEYAATKANGELNNMWRTRPAGQLAKCAEALAWRKAFPQDLSGLYTSDEMDQAEHGAVGALGGQQAQQQATVAQARQQAAQRRERSQPVPGEVMAEPAAQQDAQPSVPMCTPEQWQAILADAQAAGYTSPEDVGRAVMGALRRNISGPQEITAEEAEALRGMFTVADDGGADQATGELPPEDNGGWPEDQGPLSDGQAQ